MTDLVKERHTYVIDEEGKCGGLEVSRLSPKY